MIRKQRNMLFLDEGNNDMVVEVTNTAIFRTCRKLMISSLNTSLECTKIEICSMKEIRLYSRHGISRINVSLTVLYMFW